MKENLVRVIHPATREGYADPRSAHGCSQPMAKSVRGTTHRLSPARASGPCARSQWAPPPPDLGRLLSLLSPRSHSPLAWEGYARREAHRGPEAGSSCGFPKSVACIVATSGKRPDLASPGQSSPSARHARHHQAAHRPSPSSTCSVEALWPPSCTLSTLLTVATAWDLGNGITHSFGKGQEESLHSARPRVIYPPSRDPTHECRGQRPWITWLKDLCHNCFDSRISKPIWW